MGSGVSFCRSSTSDVETDNTNNNVNPGDEVSEDPALQKMLERFQLADQAVALNDYPGAIRIITEADQFLTMLSQKHLSEAHLHAMAIAQRKGTYRRMMNQVKEAIEEYEFGLRIGETKIQKRGTSSQYLLLHLISETSCLMAACHMNLLVACKRILKLREIQHVEDPELMPGGSNGFDVQSNSSNNNNNRYGSSSALLTEQKLNKLNDDTGAGAAAGASTSAGAGGNNNNNNTGGSFRQNPKNNNNNNNTSRPPSQLGNTGNSNNNNTNNNNNTTHLAVNGGGGGIPIGVGSTAGAASFGGRMTPQGEESSRMARGAHMRGGEGAITPSRESQQNENNNNNNKNANFLGVDGGGGRFVLSRHDRMVRHKKQILSVKVEDEDMLGAGPTSFSFAQNTSFISRNSDDGGAPDQDDDLEQAGIFQQLAARDAIMGPLMHLPSAALEVQENLHAKTAEQALLHSVELIEELQNRQSELLLGPLFRLADLYETLEMMQPCERCVRRLVGISLVKYGHDHDIYIRQHYRLLALANAKEERKTLNAAVMISKTWKMKVQMKRLRAANARTEFEPRRHVKLQRNEPPPSENRAQEVLQQIIGMHEDPPSEYEESEDDAPNFDEDYDNYNDDDLVVPGWDAAAGANDQAKKKGLLGALPKKPEEKKKTDDPFSSLKD